MEHILASLASVLVLGIVAQWLGWRLRIPAILLLLIFGFVAGPITGFLNPNELLGDLVIPVVSLSVGLILFEGGLTLKMDELRTIGRVVRNLNSISVLITWILASVGAYYLLSLSWSLAFLLGSILVVTGPTVVGPLLRHVGNIGQVGSILKWEGILIDPIGATLAVLVFGATLAGTFSSVVAEEFNLFFTIFFIGAGVGVSGAFILIELLKNHRIPDYLENPIALMLVVGTFALSDVLQHESGLLATTIMGIILANSPQINTRHILEFKEDLTVLLISVLFIVLSARLDLTIVLSEVNWNTLFFLLFLILVVRPVSVAASSVGSGLSWQERFFIAWLAPRGIVAAAVASIFALELEHAGYDGAERLVPLVFLVIVGTVTVYGLTAVPVARWLGLGKLSRPGFLIAGAHNWAQAIAKVLKEEGQNVFLVDTNQQHINEAKKAGLNALHGNILAEHVEDRIELEGLDQFLALTSNDDVNLKAVLNFGDMFGPNKVYQVAPHYVPPNGNAKLSLQDKILFRQNMTWDYIEERFKNGAAIQVINILDQFSYNDLHVQYGPEAVALFIVKQDGNLEIITDQHQPIPQPGDKVIGLVDQKTLELES